MDVRNCKGCGRLFNYYGGVPLCKACKDKLEEKFQKVKEYLRQNPNTPIQVVSEDNDVSVKQIKQWVREERLVFQKIHHLVWNVKAVEQLSKQVVSVRNANVKWKRTSRV